MELWKLIICVLYVCSIYFTWFKKWKNSSIELATSLLLLWIILTIIMFGIIYTSVDWSFLTYKVF